MRLLLLTATYPDATAPDRGAYNAALCRALADRHQVTVVSPRSWTEQVGARGRRFRPDEACVEAGIAVSFPLWWHSAGVAHDHHARMMWHSIGRGAQRRAGRSAPDLVVGYWAHPDGAVAVRLAARLDVPSIVIVGGSDVLDHRHRDRARRALLGADAVVTVSAGLHQAVLALGVPGERVRVIHQGVDPAVFHPPDPAAGPGGPSGVGDAAPGPVVLWVGRMVAVKDLPLLLVTFERVRRRHPSARLVLVGDGPERRSVARRVERLGLSGSVTMTGPLEAAGVARWFRTADVTVLTSRSEGLPNVLRESVACGTPFVATDVGSVREIEADGMARLAPPGDTAALAEAVLATLARPRPRPSAPVRTWASVGDDLVALANQLR